MRLNKLSSKYGIFPRQPSCRRPRRLVAQDSLTKRHLGGSDIRVSELCYGKWTAGGILKAVKFWVMQFQAICTIAGTMLFGESTSAAEAHTLLSLAADLGINFFDSAEMYPVPQRTETHGQSEAILGQWLKTQRRCPTTIPCRDLPWRAHHRCMCTCLPSP